MDLTLLLDVAIGLSLVYMTASLFVTIVNEYIAQVWQLRGKQLAKDLQALIDDPKMVDKLKASPALKPFFTPGSKLQSYVDPNVLARMLIGGARGAQTAKATMDDIVTAIKGLDDSNLKTQLMAISQSVSGDVDAFTQQVANWADRSLTMLGEVYKKHTQIISLFVGLGLAVAFNLDTIAITQRLYLDKDAREAASATAIEVVRSTSSDVFQTCVGKSDSLRRADSTCVMVNSVVDGLKQRSGAFGKLPIGWPAPHGRSVSAFTQWKLRVIGWLLSALALSLGASFWFDLLSRLVNIRHGMKPPQAEPAKAP